MKEMVEWIKATSDIMVRVLLGQEENLPLLKDFINAVLKDRGVVPVRELKIENPINMRTVFNDKETVLDVKATDENGRILDVEIQSSGNRKFIQRSLYYWARLYSGQLESGVDYKKLNPVICINLLDFILFPDKKDDQYHSCYMLRDLDDTELLLSDHLRIHYIELPKINVDPSVIPSDRLLKWMFYFIEEGVLEEDEMKIVIKDDPIFEQAHETFNRFTADKKLRAQYEAREKRLHDEATRRSDAWEEGIEIGEKKGEKKGVLKTAAALKEMGQPVDLICKATGLSPEEVEAL